MNQTPFHGWQKWPWQVCSCAPYLGLILVIGFVFVAPNSLSAQSSLTPRRGAGISSSSVGTPTGGNPSSGIPTAGGGSTASSTAIGDVLPWRSPGSSPTASNPSGGFNPSAAPPANPPFVNGNNNPSSLGPAPGRPAGATAPSWNGYAGGAINVGAPASGPPLKVTKGSGSLPNDAGQIWREYDISPYTSRLRSKPKPEQAIVDWVIRETGQEIWFSQPLGVLNADANTLRVYHTPEVQSIVQGIVERFVRGQAEGHAFGVRIITLNSPNWRTRAFALMRPVDVQSSGVEAWLLSRENTTVLMNDLRRRSDYRELNAPNMTLVSGLTETISRTRPRSFIRSVRSTVSWPGYEGVPAQLEEGFGLQVSPLLSLDGSVCEAAIKCNIDQLERLVPITLDVTTQAGNQKVQIQVPQLVSWRMNERFRWPTDQVLLLSCGIVANPGEDNTSAISALNPFDMPGNRADAIMLVSYLGRADQQYAGPAPSAITTPTAGPSPAVNPSTTPYSPIANPYMSGRLPNPSSYNRGRY